MAKQPEQVKRGPVLGLAQRAEAWRAPRGNHYGDGIQSIGLKFTPLMCSLYVP